MILPSKHTKYDESYIVIAGIIFSFLEKPLSVDDILEKYTEYVNNKGIKQMITLESIVYAIDLLFILNKVSFDNNLILKK
ncbi:ABC-three component system middle component 6 [Flavobacterium sp.]|jgi:hypothetical protein|uniref:ABC-three component system middle component 6 n=1 Tax=Flavobacterium sp. TaxID=239 RepID=UPI003341787C